MLRKRAEEICYFCLKEACEYYGIADAGRHALVRYGIHRRHEAIQDFKIRSQVWRNGRRVSTHWMEVATRISRSLNQVRMGPGSRGVRKPDFTMFGDN